jgi:hypothetical protein
MMDTRIFKPLYDAAGPGTSVYLPTPRNERDAAHKIELEWRSLRAELAGQGAPEADLRAIDTVVGTDRGLDTPRGQAIFATDGAVVLSRELSVPPAAPRGRFDDLPDGVPLLAQTPDLGDYLLVLVDRQEAEIELRSREHGAAARDEHVRGRDRPLTKVSSGDWRQDHRQRKAENTWKANARDVAARVKELAGAYDVELIAVCGDVRARTLLMEQLGALGRSRAVELPTTGFPPGADRAHAHVAAERIAARCEYDRRAAVLDRYRQGLANGTAAGGLDAVVDALRSGEVATLLLRYDAPEADAPVWWGPDPGQLTLHARELEGTRAPRIKRGRAADVLIRALIQTDGDLLMYSGAEPGPDGVAGAVLRRG